MKKSTTSKYRKIFIKAGTAFLISLLLSVLYYLVFCMLLPTDVEKRLMSENSMYLKEIDKVNSNLDLMKNEILYLESKDADIYKHIFNSNVPVEGIAGGDASVTDTYATVHSVDSSWNKIYDMIQNARILDKYPMRAPVGGLDCTSVGASVGSKLNPFYKVQVQHDGVDLMASPGTAVTAPADGKVTKVNKSEGGYGNVVEITHADGYVTTYAHLSSILVKKGKKVKTGDVIGLVGDSGRAFGVHLHYALSKDGKVLDPLTYFVLGNYPHEYFDMLLNGASTGQSMD